jgi:hypothetical protein
MQSMGKLPDACKMQKGDLCPITLLINAHAPRNKCNTYK